MKFKKNRSPRLPICQISRPRNLKQIVDIIAIQSLTARRKTIVFLFANFCLVSGICNVKRNTMYLHVA